MRRCRFYALFLLVLTLGGSAIHAANRLPYFVVLPTGAELNDFSDRLEAMGARIRMRVPPNILTFDAEESVNIQAAGPISHVYQAFIPLNELSAYGPLAEAAGIQWNREIIQGSSTLGTQTILTMRAQAALSSLPGPTNLTASVDGSRVHAIWSALPGAASYLVQLSKTVSFSPKVQAAVMKPEADLPRLEATTTGPVYVRVRGIDGDVQGAWSELFSFSGDPFASPITQAAPVLTSPLDQASSDGWTIVLEWIAQSNTWYSVQVAETEEFRAPFAEQAVLGGEFTVPSAPLKAGKTYFWRVRSWSENGSNWSPTRRFKVGEPVHTENDALINPEAPQ